MGIEHALLPKGSVGAGDLVIRADSHTCTYGALGAFSTGVGSTDMAAGMASGQAWFKVPSAIRFNLSGKFAPYVSGKDLILHIIGMIGVDGALYQSMEFTGPGVANLSIDDRFTIANMAIEAGAKNGIFPVDEVALAYMAEHYRKEPRIYEADSDAEYEKTYEIDLCEVKNTVSFPTCPPTPVPLMRWARSGSQVVIGSCTNGPSMTCAWQRDPQGEEGGPHVRALIFPATQKIWKQAMSEGSSTSSSMPAVPSRPPPAGPASAVTWILAEGERAVSTTNRNFVGRMGHPKSEVHLASPGSRRQCCGGYIMHPKKIMEA